MFTRNNPASKKSHRLLLPPNNATSRGRLVEPPLTHTHEWTRDATTRGNGTPRRWLLAPRARACRDDVRLINYQQNQVQLQLSALAYVNQYSQMSNHNFCLNVNQQIVRQAAVSSSACNISTISAPDGNIIATNVNKANVTSV